MSRYNRYAVVREDFARNLNALPDTLLHTPARDKAKVCREERRCAEGRLTKERERKREMGGSGRNRGIARRTREGRERIFVRVGTQWQRESQLPAGPEVDGRPSWQPDVHPKCLARFVRMNCI